GVEAFEIGAKSLLAEIGSGVDDDILILVREEQRRAEASVTRIGGLADTAVTAECGNSHGSAGAEDGEREGGWSGGGRCCVHGRRINFAMKRGLVQRQGGRKDLTQRSRRTQREGKRQKQISRCAFERRSAQMLRSE